MTLLAEYSFEDGTGAAVTDVSGNGNGLTRGPNGTWVAGHNGSFAIRSRVQHTEGTAGSGAYGAFPGGSPGTNSFSVLFWAKAPTVPDDWSAFVGAVNSSDGEPFLIWVKGDGSVEADWVNDNGLHPSAPTSQQTGVVGLDEWVHVAGIFQPGTGSTLYVNGSVATVYDWQADSGESQGNWATLLVGGSRWGSGGACIDDLRLYDEALSQSQITTLMNIPVGETPSDTVNQLRLGDQTISKLYLGSQEAERAYLGSTIVYGSAPSGETPTNQSPTASFTTGQNNLSVTTNASASVDSDGTIVGYGWDWGDGATSTGVNGSHTYASNGSYTIILTVTDNLGATGTYSRLLTVSDGGFVPNLINNPSAGGYPDATNTGVPVGATLTASGALTVNTNGAVIQNLNIVNGHITVNANNVTIRNCRITTYDYYPIENNGTGLVVEDCEITGTVSSVTSSIAGSNYTARRCNLSGGADGLKANSNVVIVDCYIHDLRVSDGSHNDGIQTVGGDNGTVTHNTIDVGGAGVAIQFGSTNQNWTIDNNLIRATGWAINGGTGVQNSIIANNRFARMAGWYGPIGVEGSGNSIYGNYYDDDGSAV